MTLFEEPDPLKVYSGGIDTALGIVGKDRDVFEVFDQTVTPHRQVCEVVGHLGERFHKVVYGVCRLFHGNVFIVAERAAMGLATLRTLRDDYAYSWLYREEVLDRRTKKKTKRLGYAKSKGASDPAVVRLRTAIRQGELEVRSPALVRELSACQFKARDSMDPDEAADGDMKVKLAGGGSPDMMMATAYAVWGLGMMQHAPRPKPSYPVGSLGQILNHDEVGVEGVWEARKRAEEKKLARGGGGLVGSVRPKKGR